jgi:hypothetical protein
MLIAVAKILEDPGRYCAAKPAQSPIEQWQHAVVFREAKDLMPVQASICAGSQCARGSFGIADRTAGEQQRELCAEAGGVEAPA